MRPEISCSGTHTQHESTYIFFSGKARFATDLSPWGPLRVASHFVYIFYRWCVRLLVNSICAGNVCVCVPLLLLLLVACSCLVVAFGGKTPSTHAQQTRNAAAADQIGTGNGPNTPREQHLRPRADHFWTQLFPTFDPLSPPILTHFRRFAAKSRKRRESRTFGRICRISLPTTTVGVESGAGKC